VWPLPKMPASGNTSTVTWPPIGAILLEFARGVYAVLRVVADDDVNRDFRELIPSLGGNHIESGHRGFHRENGFDALRTFGSGEIKDLHLQALDHARHT
jgi:hypothetical protein